MSLGLGQRSESIVNRLPFDVLFRILDDPELAWDGSQPNVSASRRCPWSIYLKTRKNVVQVCRAWRAAGSSFLYSTVYLHRIGHLTGFVHSLKRSQRNQIGFENDTMTTVNGDFVRHIHVSPYVPRIWRDVYKQEMLEILHLCPKLQTLDSRPIWDGYLPPVPEASLLWTIQNAATDLPLYQFDEQTGMVSILSNLTKLHLNIDLDSATYTSLARGVVLENLEDLACDIPSRDSYASLAQISTWKLPKLSSFSLAILCRWDQMAQIDLKPVDLICDKFGQGLRRFLIDTRMCKGRTNGMIFHILVRCPSLETFVYDQHTVSAMSPEETDHLKVHASLRRIEFLWSHTSVFASSGIFMVQSVYPNLRTFVARDPVFDELPVRSTYGLEKANVDPRSDEIKRLKGIGYQFLNRYGEPIVYDIDPDESRSQSGPAEHDTSSEGEEEEEDRAYRPPSRRTSSESTSSWTSSSEPISDDSDEDDTDSLINEVVNRVPRSHSQEQITREEALAIVASMTPSVSLEDYAVGDLSF